MEDARERFRRELATFEAGKSSWIEDGHLGKWVAVLGDDVVGFIETSRDAWWAGFKRWGKAGFLMRTVLEQQKPIVISHVCLHGASIED